MRPGVDADLPFLVAIAREGGSPDADLAHLRHVARVGRLVVATDDGVMIGFAGAVPVGDLRMGETWMVSDLFVDPSSQGRGTGGRLLAAVVGTTPKRMTFSSTHPAALAAYRRLGMLPRERLLTMRRSAGGGGRAPVPGVWRHDRADLVEYFRSRGAVVTADHVTVTSASASTILRAVGDAYVPVLADALDHLPADLPVELSVLEHHPAARWLRAEGFTVVDEDVFCCNAEVKSERTVISLHRGLH